MKRGNGILAHIASLPSDYGIGNVGAAAFKFIDRLKASRQSYWQITPCTDCGPSGDPYDMLSAFAGNACLIDPAELISDGIIKSKNCTPSAENPGCINYKSVTAQCNALTDEAYTNGIYKYFKEFSDFQYENAYWLFDYSLYAAIRESRGDKSPDAWPDGLKSRDPETLMAFSQKHAKEIDRIAFAQFLFFTQLKKLREYADQNGITLIGELTYYINEECADCWAQPELLSKDTERVCPDVPGAPLNIPYNWDYCKKNSYRWWMARIAHWLNYFHCLKINRMGDFYSYCVAEDGAQTGQCDPENPYIRYGPGYDFNAALRRHMPAACIIAGAPADLGQKGYLLNCGYITAYIIQDAFEEDGEKYLPYNMNRAAAYQISRLKGSSCRSWFLQSSDEVKQNLLHYFGPFGPYSFYASFDEDNVTIKLMRAAMSSVADICIIPMADILNLTDAQKLYSADRRENWVWRMEEKDLHGPQMERLKQMTQTYGRD